MGPTANGQTATTGGGRQSLSSLFLIAQQRGTGVRVAVGRRYKMVLVEPASVRRLS